MINADGTMRTDDMAFAAILSCHGFSPALEIAVDPEGGRRSGIWVLPQVEVTDTVRELVEDYLAGRTRIEPRKFMREVRAVRQQLYKFLDHSATRV